MRPLTGQADARCGCLLGPPCWRRCVFHATLLCIPSHVTTSELYGSTIVARAQPLRAASAVASADTLSPRWPGSVLTSVAPARAWPSCTTSRSPSVHLGWLLICRHTLPFSILRSSPVPPCPSACPLCRLWQLQSKMAAVGGDGAYNARLDRVAAARVGLEQRLQVGAV